MFLFFHSFEVFAARKKRRKKTHFFHSFSLSLFRPPPPTPPTATQRKKKKKTGMLKFHVQEYERCANYILPACSLAAGRHIDQTFGVLDVKGVGLRHLTGDVKRMLTRVMSVDQDNFPEMMGHTCIINAPSVFKAIWAFVRPMLDARTQAKVEVCPAKFAPALLRWVAPENLPEYLGGQSTATLLDDSGPWQVRMVFFAAAVVVVWVGRGEGEGERAKERKGKELEKEKHVTHFFWGRKKNKTKTKTDDRTPLCSPPSRPPRPRGKGGGTRRASPRRTKKRRKRRREREGRAGEEQSSRSRVRRASPRP